MGNLFEYIDWRGDISFDQVPLGEVDNLIFTQIAYLDFFRIVPATPTARPVGFLAAVKRHMQAHKGESAQLGAIMPPELVSFAAKVARSSRFAATSMVGYVNRISDGEQTQFSAVTYLIGDDLCFIAYRGTDDTLVGWKESFNMSFMSPIPAQTEAKKYLERVAAAMPERRIYLGGHSKGGNLAVYAAVKCAPEVKERIVTVYNNDGPGFDREFIASEEYAAMREHICTIVPQSSIVGMLLEHEESYEVVQSKQTGLLQHNGFSWDIVGGSFVHLDTVTKESKYIDRTLKKWLSEMSIEKRKKILDSLFDYLASTNAKTLTELNADKFKLIKAWNTLDAESKTFLKRCIKLILNRKYSK